MLRIGALVLGLAVVSAGGTAMACYDEDKRESYDRDFHLEYSGPVDMAGSDTFDDGPRIPFGSLMAAGAVMVTGSVALIAKRSRTWGE